MPRGRPRGATYTSEVSLCLSPLDFERVNREASAFGFNSLSAYLRDVLSARWQKGINLEDWSMAAFPKTRGELQAQGYVLLSKSPCRGESCNADIQFWRTPSGARLPLNAMSDDPQDRAVPHWATCPDRKQFRKRGTNKK